MAAKKPLLPPGSRWNTLEKSKTVIDDKAQDSGKEISPKLIASVSTTELTTLCDNVSYRKPPRSNSDDLLSHDKTHSQKPLPPTPPLNVKFRIDVGSAKRQRSPTIPAKPPPPPPPFRTRNSPQSPNRVPKPPIVPRKIHSTSDEVDTQVKPKPPLPRKPRTVHVAGRPVLRKPNIGEPKHLEPSGLLQNTTDVHVSARALSPNRDNQSKIKIPINESNKNLEKILMSKSIDLNTKTAVKNVDDSDRPTSMILTSQTALDEEDFPPFSTIPRAKPSRDSKKLAMTTSHDKVNKRKGLFHKLKKVLQINENYNENIGDSSSSSEEEEEIVNGENEEDMDNKGGTIKRVDPMMEDIKKTLQEILDCQQSLMRRLAVVENAIKEFRPKLRHVSTEDTQRKRASMVDAADPSNEFRHLFEFVMVVGLRQVKTTGKYEPYVTYRFPPASQKELSKDQAVQEIPNFCFPDINTIKPLMDYSSETFSFVLTDVDGNRRFGYCRRLLPSGDEPRLPEVYCIVSVLGCFSMYEKILNNLEERRKVSPSAAYTLLRAILANPFPAPGKSVEVSAFSVKGDGMEVIKFTRPMDSRLEHVDFSILFSCLDMKHIIQLFSAMLMERRIIFCAEKLSTFSSCCHAATSLLYPCDWQHIFIPVLPNKLIDFCCSPLPYILGILPHNIPLLEDMDIEEVYIVHLDNGKVLNKMGDESMILPAKAKAYLEDHLAVIMEQWEQQGTLNSTAVADTFLTFFAYILGNYSQFMEVKNPVTDEKSFKIEKYIKSFSSEAVRRFLDAFQNTQMFDVFVQQRETPVMYSSIANGYFEKNLTRLKDRSKDIDMMNTGRSLAAKWKKFVAKKFKSS